MLVAGLCGAVGLLLGVIIGACFAAWGAAGIDARNEAIAAKGPCPVCQRSPR